MGLLGRLLAWNREVPYYPGRSREKQDPVIKALQVTDTPRPEALMAHFIALRLTQLQPEGKYRECEGFWTLNLREGRTLEVRWDFRRLPRVTVGVAGSPRYRSVELTKEEQSVIMRPLIQLRMASEERERVRLEHESQCAALEVLEDLL